ncbi:MAG: hypothetical protein ACI4S2_01630 [Lachnospiraceae bacterium]
MKDNEKRAHDLAIATLPFIYNNASSNDEPFDIYEAYMSTYKEALKSFNRDFPE